jgi:hypothetical protein
MWKSCGKNIFSSRLDCMLSNKAETEHPKFQQVRLGRFKSDFVRFLAGKIGQKFFA